VWGSYPRKTGRSWDHRTRPAARLPNEAAADALATVGRVPGAEAAELARHCDRGPTSDFHKIEAARKLASSPRLHTPNAWYEWRREKGQPVPPCVAATLAGPVGVPAVVRGDPFGEVKRHMLSALLLGTGVLLVSLLFFALAIVFIVHLMARVMRTGYAGDSFWKNVTIMSLVTLVTAAAHLAEIALWAAAFVACGQFPAFEDAFYFSAESYTSLGYGDIVLSGRWRILGPLEAINGLLLFGLSTAAMFAVLSRLVASHIPSPDRHEGERAASVDPERAESIQSATSSAATGRRQGS
jgi:hypothetical protein